MIYITGDTHGDVRRFFEPQLPCAGWGPEDKIIVAGDFGMLFGNGETDGKKLDLLARCPFQILFLDGNHECFPEIAAYPEELYCGGKVHRIRDNIRHLMRGQVYEIEGLRIFTMGGGYSIDRMLRVAGRNWWPEEMPSEAEYAEGMENLSRCGYAVDVLISHAAPTGSMLDLKKDGTFSMLFPQEVPLGNYLQKVAGMTRHRHYYFGHIHLDRELPGNRTALYYAVYCLNTGMCVKAPDAGKRG
ncbi:MAG: metallophosphoesterase [Clostridia bacterium]|nr:metallophosphoesterase [Clostridia bacterium]